MRRTWSPLAMVGLAVACEGDADDAASCPDDPYVPPTTLGTPGDFSAATPFVVSTVPLSGDATVDPSMDRIRVTFSVPMVEESHAFVSVNDLFPEMSDPVWIDDRTVVADVTLEPGHTYELWVNDPHGIHTHYRSVAGPSAGPYGLVFHTTD